jgi:hypothetical protein
MAQQAGEHGVATQARDGDESVASTEVDEDVGTLQRGHDSILGRDKRIDEWQ